MRVTTDIWVHVFLRREAERSAFATVLKKGAAEAGSIFIIENNLENLFTLYAPAPQSMLESDDGERKFESVLDQTTESIVESYLDKQQNFDPDLWVIETQSRKGPPSIDVL